MLCEMEKVVVAVQKQFLRQEAVPESSLYLGQPACNVSHSNSSHVLLVAGWGECGTLVQSVRPGPREGAPMGGVGSAPPGLWSQQGHREAKGLGQLQSQG